MKEYDMCLFFSFFFLLSSVVILFKCDLVFAHKKFREEYEEKCEVKLKNM